MKNVINNSPYIRAHHGVCKTQRGEAAYLQHTVAIACWYIPNTHTCTPFRLMGYFELEKALEFVCERGLDYTTFSAPTSGRMHFPASKALPKTATATVFEISKLIPIGQGEEIVEVSVQFGYYDSNNKWNVKAKELGTTLPGFFGQNAEWFVKNLNAFCGYELCKLVAEPAAVLNHRVDNGITVVRKVKKLRTGKPDTAVVSAKELSTAIAAVQYPEAPTAIQVAGQEIRVQAWFNSAVKAAICNQLKEAGISTKLIARIPVYDIPMQFDRDRLPRNLEYEITRLLSRHGHSYSYNEVDKAYYAVHRDKLQDQTHKQKLVSFSAFAQKQHKFLQSMSYGHQGSIWD